MHLTFFVLNAFRHHSYLHPACVPPLEIFFMCSTPFGITAIYIFVRTGDGARYECAQRLSASQLSTFAERIAANLADLCSTPFGITAINTHERGSAATEPTVLNAFRHHSYLHTATVYYTVGFEKCSTPFGITAIYTVCQSGVCKFPSWCSTPFGITAIYIQVQADRVLRDRVLNALRHHSYQHIAVLGELGVVSKKVLNAFRHHSYLHMALSLPVPVEGRCSTPFGITAIYMGRVCGRR